MTKQWIELTRERAKKAAEAILKNYGDSGWDLYYDVENDDFYTTCYPRSALELDGDLYVASDVCDPVSWGDDIYDEDDPETIPSVDLIADLIMGGNNKSDWEDTMNGVER